MIRLVDLSHAYRADTPIFSDATVAIPGDRRVALLGGIESGKTTLVQILAGLTVPDQGRIERHARVSFPAGYQRGFRIASTVRQNIDFAARVYGADAHEVADFVARVTGLGPLLDRTMRDLSVQERMMASFALTYAIPFDTYLFDNSVVTGLPEFRERCLAMYEARSATAGTIVATRHVRVAEQLCDCVLLIRDRKLVFFDDLADGIAAYRAVGMQDDPMSAAMNPDVPVFEEQP